MPRGGLQAVGFDAERHEVVGSPVSVLESVYRAPGRGAPFFEVSQTGSLVYLSGGLERSLMWVDHDGQGSPVTEERRGFRWPRLSPDGNKVAVIIDPRPSEVWVYDLERNTRSLLYDGAHAVTPRWTSDGMRVIFSTGQPYNNLHWMPADGSGDAEPLLTGERHQYAYSVSRDGRFLSFQEQHPTTDWDIWVLPLEGDRIPEPFLVTPSREVSASFSPDGQWVAYLSDVSGEYEVYVQPFRGSGARVSISTNGGTNPAWSADGAELFYREGNRIMVVAVETGPRFVAGTPEILVDGAYYNPEDNGGFDVSADGRFLMARPDPNAVGDHLQVVLNWDQELLERVPVN